MSFTTDKLVSIIVPVYNAEKYLPQCIESILAQTYLNTEILLVDDGSLDSCGRICEEYAGKDARIRVLHKENGGLSSARNYGLKYAKGEYISFVDADDWIDRIMVEECMKMVQSDPETDCILFGYVRDDGKSRREVHHFTEDKCFHRQEIKNYLLRRLTGPVGEELRFPLKIDNLSSAWAKVYRRDLIAGNSFTDLRIIGTAEDLLFNLQALGKARNIRYLNRCMYNYRRDGRGLTKTYKKDFDKKMMTLFSFIRESVNEIDTDPAYRQAFYNRTVLSITSVGLNFLRNPDASFFESYHALKQYLNTPMYKEAVSGFPLEELLLFWKVFLFFCKHRAVLPVYVILVLVKNAR